MVSVTFNGQSVSNPVEWEEMSVSLSYDHTNQMLEVTYDDTLTFTQDAFEYLYSRRNDSCQLISTVITSTCGSQYLTLNGNIFITDCVFDELQCTVKVTIQDDGYGSRIQNNKRTKVGLASTTTKNGLALTLPEKRYVTMFTPSNGFYSNLVVGYTIYESFKFLVSWMSDNEVSFASDFFETGDGKDDWICSGVDIRQSTVPPTNEIEPPSISFDSLYTLMRKVRNVAIGFDRDGSNNPVLRIEEVGYFRSGTVGLYINNVNRTELSYIKELLYARIKIGSSIVRPPDCDSGDTNCSAANNISYYGFDQEEYYITGECNEDVDLDLTIDNDFVIDTNTIEDVLIYGNQSYDKSVFLIHTFENTPSAYRASQSDVFNIGAYWYNEQYTNKFVLARYIDYLTGTLVLFNLYNGINLFLYEGNTPSSPLLPSQTPSYTNYPSITGQGIPLNDLIYDPFNTIDTGTERYYPPNDGVYQFCVGIAIDDFPLSDAGVIVGVYLQIQHFDSSNNLIDTYISDLRAHTTTISDPIFEDWISPWIPMNAGDYAIFNVSYAQNLNTGVAQAQIVLGGSDPRKQYFQCCASRVAVDDAQINTGQDRRVAKTSFEYPIPMSDFANYISDTSQTITVSNQRIDRNGWIESMKFNISTGKSEVSILSNDN